MDGVVRWLVVILFPVERYKEHEQHAKMECCCPWICGPDCDECKTRERRQCDVADSWPQEVRSRRDSEAEAEHLIQNWNSSALPDLYP